MEMVSQAVKHIEPDRLIIVWKKFYRWGYTSKDAHLGKYRDLIQKKERVRTGMFGPGLFIVSLGSALLLAMKGLPYAAGLIASRIKQTHSAQSKPNSLSSGAQPGGVEE